MFRVLMTTRDLINQTSLSYAIPTSCLRLLIKLSMRGKKMKQDAKVPRILDMHTVLFLNRYILIYIYIQGGEEPSPLISWLRKDECDRQMLQGTFWRPKNIYSSSGGGNSQQTIYSPISRWCRLTYLRCILFDGRRIIWSLQLVMERKIFWTIIRSKQFIWTTWFWHIFFFLN